MNAQSRKAEAWRAAVVSDVFELWIGISRLMARVSEPRPARRQPAEAMRRSPARRRDKDRRAARRERQTL
jgi:hypothetical protein